MLRRNITTFARRYITTGKNTDTFYRAQINIRDIINRPNEYKTSIERRQLPQELIEDVDFIIKNREIQFEMSRKVNDFKHQRNELAEMLKSKTAPNPQECKDKLKEIKNDLKPLEHSVKELEELIYTKAENLPNLIDETVPTDPFKEDIVQFINCASAEDALNQLPPTETYDHKTIGENFNIFNFSTASRISGSSWYYLVGDGALLEQALVQYGLSKARKYGYKMIAPPSIVKSEVVHACGFKPNDQNNEKQVYELEGEGKSLTGTAEIPLGAYHSSTVFEAGTDFPKKYAGVSRSYRAEAGASGKDTKGLYRVHEFTKVELFHFTTPENAAEELEQIKDLQVEIISELGLKAKLLNMPTSDLGSPAMKKYDTEAWMPGRGNWGELTSCSNCGDYQSRRLGIKYHRQNEEKLGHVHTLNGTCMAVPRVIVALVEQNYNPETNEISIPEVLRPYMDGKDKIIPN
ncbi:DIA4 [[Candida] subhashii]|uniref:serine--tRNA ligase n=1 Tax=[Candida] subhashii TaxID=561895 RepID=A0A8J5QC30_9ASCO|nr:DIA4 [[Candida] subhashii]KAG7662466.1 DIA4 [[Candida] subhashii]